MTIGFVLGAIFTFHLIFAVSSLDNGLTLTPPMGWMTWERFRCNTDCDNDPNNCIRYQTLIVAAQFLVYNYFMSWVYLVHKQIKKQIKNNVLNTFSG